MIEMGEELQVLGAEAKQKKRRRWVLGILGFVAVIIIASGLVFFVKYAVKGAMNFDEKLIRNDGDRGLDETSIILDLQDVVDSLLDAKLTEIDGLQGQVVVMEVQTGHILAMVGLERNFEGKFHSCRNFAYQQELGAVAMTASLLAALETDKVALTDMVDTGNGVWTFDNDGLMKDHNWHRGGYGMMTFGRALEASSNIGISKAVMRAFGNDAQAFLDQLARMSYGQPDSIMGIEGLCRTTYSSPKDSDWVSRRFFWHAVGYERLMAPIQMLTFYNAIANDGKMVKPTLAPKDHVEVINLQIASKKNVRLMQDALERVVSQGLGIKAGTPLLRVAGKTATSQVAEYFDHGDGTVSEYQLGFCGYFPANEPKYSIIVSMNKLGLPASGGGMAGPVFRDIVEWMIAHGACL